MHSRNEIDTAKISMNNVYFISKQNFVVALEISFKINFRDG